MTTQTTQTTDATTKPTNRPPMSVAMEKSPLVAM